jgi:immune inhibitor A
MELTKPIDGNPDFDVIACLDTLALHHPDRCTVAPNPDLADKIKREVDRLQSQKRVGQITSQVKLPGPKAPGLNDALIIPGSYFPLGTSLERVRSAGAERAPLSGVLRVIVVLAEFSDRAMTATQQDFEDLFFSTGVVPTGSVREYFAEVTNGLVDIQGDVVGPYMMPQTLAAYANGASGTGGALPNARTMARDAAVAADPDVNFAPYDNDSNGFVDAFIVVHAGAGAEVTGSTGDIWSHKWVLSGGEYVTDTTKIYAYLTVPEDARLGVCAHELGHLLFGLPDLYDTDQSSAGIGNWCLMAGGSWLGGGNTPAHPSAWCKVQQAWVTVQNVTTNGPLNLADVKDNQTVYRLWKDGTSGQEYFLVENRQKTRYDAELPGEGLLIWHVDEAIPSNTDEAHPKVALEQADGNDDLGSNSNRGDDGDPWPGSTNNASFNNSSTPDSKSYAGVNTCVSVTGISAPAAVMSAQIGVACPAPKNLRKDFKDQKEQRKEYKEFRKEDKDRKEFAKDFKERRKEFKDQRKDFKEQKEQRKEFKEVDKRVEKPTTDKGQLGMEKPPITEWRSEGFEFEGTIPASGGSIAELEARIAALESRLQGAGPYIGEELRPDLTMSPYSAEDDIGGPSPLDDKRNYDSKPYDN